MAFKVFDIHPHVISTDEAKYPRDPLGGHQSVWSKERPVSAEQMVKEMDAAGVEKSAVVHASTCYGYDASYLADSMAKYPKYFTGVCSVDVLSPDAPERIRYWASRGMKGLRIFTVGSTMTTQSTWLDDPRSYPAWEEVQAQGWPMCLQVRIPGMAMVKNMIERFPKVNVIVDHMMGVEFDDGAPFAKAAPLFDLVRYPNVHLKVSSNNVRVAKKLADGGQAFFTKVVKEFGSDRMAWGSNFPAQAGTLKEIVDESKAALAFLPEKDQLNIFRNTSLKLYPVLGS